MTDGPRWPPQGSDIGVGAWGTRKSWPCKGLGRVCSRHRGSMCKDPEAGAVYWVWGREKEGSNWGTVRMMVPRRTIWKKRRFFLPYQSRCTGLHLIAPTSHHTFYQWGCDFRAARNAAPIPSLLPTPCARDLNVLPPPTCWLPKSRVTLLKGWPAHHWCDPAQSGSWRSLPGTGPGGWFLCS